MILNILLGWLSVKYVDLKKKNLAGKTFIQAISSLPCVFLSSGLLHNVCGVFYSGNLYCAHVLLKEKEAC